MAARIEDGEWARLGEAARSVRHVVFVIEQNIPVKLEDDGLDPECHHVVAFDQDAKPIGTARLLPNAHLGRMCVLKNQRGKGVGSELVKRLLQVARAKGYSKVILESQVHAKDFYLKLGFVQDKERGVFMTAGIPHVEMSCSFV